MTDFNSQKDTFLQLIDGMNDTGLSALGSSLQMLFKDDLKEQDYYSRVDLLMFAVKYARKCNEDTVETHETWHLQDWRTILTLAWALLKQQDLQNKREEVLEFFKTAEEKTIKCESRSALPTTVKYKREGIENGLGLTRYDEYLLDDLMYYYNLYVEHSK